MRKITTTLWFMGLATLLVFPLLALPIIYFFDLPFTALFNTSYKTLLSLPFFLSIGILFGLFIIWLSELPFFEAALSDYKNILTNFKITIWRAIYLSICAGVGEEIFFRGALQPLLEYLISPWYGIIITAIFFVAIHTYFSFKNWKKNCFALLLTSFIVLLGWAAKEFSLWHAIAGHFSYDLVLLMYLRKTN